jgi:aconitate hydratase
LTTLAPRQELTVNYNREDGSTGSFQVRARIDGPTELTYLKNGGILPAVLRRLHAESQQT